MSLLEALRNGAPLVWIDSREPEKVIAQIPELHSDRNLFIYDEFDGLMEWSRKDGKWKIVLVTIQDDNGNSIDVPIMKFAIAQGYVLGQKDATFIVRNAHKSIDDNLGFYQSLWGRYRSGFWADNGEKLPLQTICLATGAPPPPELISMFTIINIGIPSKAEITSIVNHMRQRIPGDIVGDNDIRKLVEGFSGLTEHEIIETSLSMIRETGKLDAVRIAADKFDRMKRHSSLDIAKPKFGLNDIGGLDGAKQLIQQAKFIRDNPEKAKEYGLSPIRRVMLIGVSGCGKSMICEAAAHELGLDLAKAGVSKAMSKFVGQSEENIRNMFAQINALSPIMVWIDEGGRDLSGGSSSDVVDAGTTSRVHGTFLTEMQELDPNVFLFTAANNIESLAPEMLRADRFDRIMFVGFPSYDERVEIFKLHLAGSTGVYNYQALAAATPCFTGAEIKTLIKRVRLNVSVNEDRHITTEDIVDNAPLERNRIWVRHRGLSVAMYRQARDHYEWASNQQYEDSAYIAEGREPIHGAKVYVGTKAVIK